jgi:hypothetical protein
MSRALDDAFDRLARACSTFGQSATPVILPVRTEVPDSPLLTIQPFPRTPPTREPKPIFAERGPCAPLNGPDRPRADEGGVTSTPATTPNLGDRLTTEEERLVLVQSAGGLLRRALTWVRSWFGD